MDDYETAAAQAILVALRANDPRLALDERNIGYWADCIEEQGITRERGVWAVKTYYGRNARTAMNNPGAYLAPMTPAILTELAKQYGQENGYTLDELAHLRATERRLYETMVETYAECGRQSQQGQAARNAWQDHKHKYGLS